MEEIEFEFVEPQSLSRRFRKSDILVLGLDLIAGMAGSVAETLMAARNCAAMHANWRYDQEAFHDEATLQIETLTHGDED